MNYYIQGDAANADQIKAAFEKLGYEPYCWTFETEFYFTVDCTKTVQIISSSSKLINIIKTHPDYQELELPKPHYDIANFKPFDKVLVRQNDSCTWGVSFFGRYAGMFMCCNNACFIQCIPFNDDTKHLLGTTDMCDEMYINW